MRRNTSVAAAILAAGAGLLAMKLWSDNAGGVRDKATRLRLRGAGAWREGLRMADRTWRRGLDLARRGRGDDAGRHSYYDESGSYYVAEPMVDTFVGDQRTGKSAARSADVFRHPSAF